MCIFLGSFTLYPSSSSRLLHFFLFILLFKGHPTLNDNILPTVSWSVNRTTTKYACTLVFHFIPLPLPRKLHLTQGISSWKITLEQASYSYSYFPSFCVSCVSKLPFSWLLSAKCQGSNWSGGTSSREVFCVHLKRREQKIEQNTCNNVRYNSVYNPID